MLFKHTQKQEEALRLLGSDARHVLLRGGSRSGKTVVLVEALLARAIADAGADALSLINTLVGMSIDVNTRKLRLNYGTGGLSGPAIKPIALRMVYEVAGTVKIPLIGIGGIAGAADALEFILAGASAIQIGTANYYDPTVTMKTIDGLAEYCQRQESSISSLINSVQRP